MKDKHKANEIAEHRFRAVVSLLGDGLDTAKAMEIRRQITEQTGLSDRTIRRYLEQYRVNGLDGLKPKGRHMTRESDVIPVELLNQAIQLRREVPGRSVSQIIQLLVWEGFAAPGQLKRSTLQEKLSDMGYSTKQMKMYTNLGSASRRFQMNARNKLW